MTQQKLAVISLSGGMDSSSLLLRLLSDHYEITALSFDYGQKHKIELEKATELTRYLQKRGLSLRHKIIKLDGLSELLHSLLIEGNEAVPEGHYNNKNMHLTVVPNRNKIFSSIIQSVALSIAEQKQRPVQIAMGIHSGDHQIYPDCRPVFRDKDYAAFLAGNWGGEQVCYYLPYIDKDKSEVLKDGLNACLALSLDYREIYRMTFTSYQPVSYEGRLYSDYRSGSSVERVEAFIKLGIEDPIPYADAENGVVPWETVKAHVLDMIKKHQNVATDED